MRSFSITWPMPGLRVSTSGVGRFDRDGLGQLAERQRRC